MKKKFVFDFTVNDPEYFILSAISLKAMEDLASEIIVITHSPPEGFIETLNHLGINSKYTFLDPRKKQLSLPKKIHGLILSLIDLLKCYSKKRVLNLFYKKVRIGHLIYDSFLANNREATVRLYSLDLLKALYKSWRYIDFYEGLFKPEDVYFAAEQCYLEAGIPSIIAIQAQSTVLIRKGGPSKFYFQLYDNLKDLEAYPPHYVSPKDVQIMTAEEKNHAAKWSESYIENLFSGIVDPDDWNGQMAYQAKLTPDDKVLLQAIANLQREGQYKKTYCIFSHVFTDAVHIFTTGAFEDYYTWLEETLKFAAKNSDILWLIKGHPAEETYAQRVNPKDVARRFTGFKNIIYIPTSITNTQILNLFNEAITFRGTVALELAAKKKPSIICGDTFYSDFGICHLTLDKKSYFEAIGSRELRELDETQRFSALMAIFLCRNSKLVDVPYLSGYTGKNKMNEFLTHYHANADSPKELQLLENLKDHLKKIIFSKKH